MDTVPPNQLPQVAPGQPQENVPPIDDAKRDVDENKDMAALSYAWILSIFVYLAKRQSPFVRFHAKQAMVLFACSIVFWLIPIIGKLLELIVLGLCVLGFLAAAQGEWKELPIIGAVSKGEWHNVRKGWKDLVQSVVKLWKSFRNKGKNAPPQPPVTPAPPQAQSTPQPSTPSSSEPPQPLS